jgi:D-3-phosphoglycerate dehydrogenase / 2-oxoglutarate reductase
VDIKACRVLVTPTSYGKNNPKLKSDLEAMVGEVIYNPTTKPLPALEVAKLLPDMDGYIAGLDDITAEALNSANRLKVIARYGVGVDNVDLAAAAARGIVVTNTPGANSASVAEMTVGLILSLARKLLDGISATRSGGWPRINGTSLEGKTIGLLGFGAIGKQTARRLAGFDCHVLAYDPFPDKEFAAKNQVKLVSMDELLAQSDFLSLHLPLMPETQNMVNAAMLLKIKKGAFLINTARGELIDELALANALNTGQLAGAALDVFKKEPPSDDNLLLKLPQVIVTPHISSHTDGATDAMGWMALADCLAVLRGEHPLHLVSIQK